MIYIIIFVLSYQSFLHQMMTPPQGLRKQFTLLVEILISLLFSVE